MKYVPKTRTMIIEYTHQIEALFNLIENQSMSNTGRNHKLQNILIEFGKKKQRQEHRKAIKIAKNALNGLEDSNSSNY